jgi:hypothetical protein
MKATLFTHNTSRDNDDYWIEGGHRVQLDKDTVDVDADPPSGEGGHVCTIWCRHPFPGSVQAEFDARVVRSSIHANNLNFFLGYAEADGGDLYATRHRRADGEYAKYHNLHGYIFTFLNDRHGESDRDSDGLPVARLRIRRCPGFTLLAERYGYHCREGSTYHTILSADSGRLSATIDNTFHLEAFDPTPLPGGYLGFRTFRTHVIWSNLIVTTPGV